MFANSFSRLFRSVSLMALVACVLAVGCLTGCDLTRDALGNLVRSDSRDAQFARLIPIGS